MTKMKVIFGTTNKRKIEDLLNIITNNNLDVEVLTLEDINWGECEIEENGKSLEKFKKAMLVVETLKD